MSEARKNDAFGQGRRWKQKPKNPKRPSSFINTFQEEKDFENRTTLAIVTLLRNALYQ